MSFEEHNYLIMLTDDEIDYENLSDHVLKGLALDVEPYIAQSALTELLLRESSQAVPTAVKILSSSLADQYLRGTALKILFRMERDKALDYMIEYTPNVEPYVLNRMMTLLLYESDFRYELAASRLIASQLQKIEDKQELEPEVVKDFKSLTFDLRVNHELTYK